MPRPRPRRTSEESPDETAPLSRAMPATSYGAAPAAPRALKERLGWLGRFGAIELENTGSVARDHLALERTFLAWLRTSLAFASIGIAVTQLFRLNTAIKEPGTEALRSMGKPLGATFLAVSIVVLLTGVNRYYESQSWLLKGKFPASRGSILLLTGIAVALIVASLAIVLSVSPRTLET